MDYIRTYVRVQAIFLPALARSPDSCYYMKRKESSVDQTHPVNPNKALTKGAIFMLLAIDAGNSNTSVGLFDREKNLRFLASLDTDSRKTADQICIDLM